MIADLSGKSALITGGASGIGRGISLALASQGSDVAIADINIEGASKVAEEVKKLGRHSIAINVDVTDNSSITAMVNKTVKEFTHIDITDNSGWRLRIKKATGDRSNTIKAINYQLKVSSSDRAKNLKLSLIHI